jgi:hypothetical protein
MKEPETSTILNIKGNCSIINSPPIVHATASGPPSAASGLQISALYYKTK